MLNLEFNIKYFNERGDKLLINQNCDIRVRDYYTKLSPFIFPVYPEKKIQPGNLENN